MALPTLEPLLCWVDADYRTDTISVSLALLGVSRGLRKPTCVVSVATCWELLGVLLPHTVWRGLAHRPPLVRYDFPSAELTHGQDSLEQVCEEGLNL